MSPIVRIDGTEAKGALEILANISFIAWLPVVWFEWRRERRRERGERLRELGALEREVYSNIDAMYVEFLKLCFEHPYLDVFDIRDEHAEPLSPAQKKEERVAFALLTTIFERAFLLHGYDRTDASQQQWAGWDAHIRQYFRRQNFREAWRRGIASYDPRFEAYMARVEQETEEAMG